MLFMGYRSADEIGSALLCERKHLPSLGRFIERLLGSKNRVIVSCIKYGLPAVCTVEVPYPNQVRCKSCGSNVFMIPCVSCSASSWRPDEMKMPVGKPAVPEFPTKAEPGSREKVEIMRERVSRGESPFHECDAIKLR